MSFATDADTQRLLRDHQTRTGQTFADTILDAIEASHDHLETLVASHQPQIIRGPLFTRSRKRTEHSVRVQISLRLPVTAITTIDSVAATCGAANRSQLITAALNHYLTSGRGA